MKKENIILFEPLTRDKNEPVFLQHLEHGIVTNKGMAESVYATGQIGPRCPLPVKETRCFFGKNLVVIRYGKTFIIWWG